MHLWIALFGTNKLGQVDPANPATIVGVLEPSVPYPAATEIIANVVTSPHHMSATMQDGRVHRMTELFGRLAPGAKVSVQEVEAVAPSVQPALSNSFK